MIYVHDKKWVLVLLVYQFGALIPEVKNKTKLVCPITTVQHRPLYQARHYSTKTNLKFIQPQCKSATISNEHNTPTNEGSPTGVTEFL